MPIRGVEDGRRRSAQRVARGYPGDAGMCPDILAPSHQRRITVSALKAEPPTRGQHIMRQAWRGLALLAVGALTMGGSVALAHDRGGHGKGNGNGNGALAPTIFTMAASHGNPPVVDASPEGV